ncbi:MAG TPA: hypothetical protein VN699_01670 [Pirellulales bacterium]|nr:hypothetical protein [Pirellulales bacterium]
MIVSFRPARRWLQFSLRTFLVAVTIGCVWLGWTVERARRRSQAIDTIVNEGGALVYDDDDELTFVPPGAPKSHFWLDLKGIPIKIVINETVNATLGLNLARVDNIQELTLVDSVDSDLEFLEGIRGKVDILLRSEQITGAAVERLRKRLPDAKITLRRPGRNG